MIVRPASMVRCVKTAAPTIVMEKIVVTTAAAVSAMSVLTVRTVHLRANVVRLGLQATTVKPISTIVSPIHVVLAPVKTV